MKQLRLTQKQQVTYGIATITLIIIISGVYYYRENFGNEAQEVAPSVSNVASIKFCQPDNINCANVASNTVVTNITSAPSPQPSVSVSPSSSPSAAPTASISPLPSASVSSLPSPTPTPSSIKITNVTVAGVKRNDAKVKWSTDWVTYGTVRYGTGATNLNFSATDSRLSTSHTVQLKKLTQNTKYYLIIEAKQSDGKTEFSPLYTFSTRR